jgi:SAM-dependent methyltransferase
LDVNISPIEVIKFPENYFDIVVALNVLSHLNDPTGFFEKIHAMLKREGLLVFETGNKGAMKSKWQGEILGENWLTPEHRYHFSEDSLAVLIKKVGFKVICLSKSHIVDQSLSAGVLGLNRSTCSKWILKRLLSRFDVMRTAASSLLKFYFIDILKADVSSLLYIVRKE